MTNYMNWIQVELSPASIVKIDPARIVGVQITNIGKSEQEVYLWVDGDDYPMKILNEVSEIEHKMTEALK